MQAAPGLRGKVRSQKSDQNGQTAERGNPSDRRPLTSELLTESVMNHISHTKVRTFFSPRKSVYALCVAAAGLAVGSSASAFAASALAEDAEDKDREVSVSSYGTVDLAVQDTDLAQVLQMLSIQSKKNIVTSPTVSATVTANLYDVSFHEALDSVLRVNGYGYIEEGNFVYVYTLAELEEIERANRRTESRIFELEHLSALDAQEFVEPLLSDDGKISARGEVPKGFRPEITDGGADDYAFTAKIVVNDYPQNLEAIAELLSQLDTAPQQVLVEATVLRTTLNEDNAFGIDFSVIGSMNFTDLLNPLSPVSDLLLGNNVPGEKATEDAGFHPTDNRAAGVQSPMGQTHRPGGLKVGVIRDNVSVFMRVLDEVSDSKVLARPKILALNRQRAQVLVGEKVAYRSTTATQTSTTQNVEFLNTGIELAFRPFIARNGMIRMELQPKVSFAALRELGDGEQVPDEFTNELTTNVRVRDGETLVLGGLFQEEITKTRRQVPLFGDIPLLGAAFRGHDDTVSRSEIIFLITPTIVHDEMLWEMGKDALAYTDAVQVGARAGLLPFSNTRMTMHYNQMAIDAYNAGNFKRAEFYINTSLRLHSSQPEMIRLRQMTTGEQEVSFERSILERVVRRELGPLREEQEVGELGWNDGEEDPTDDQDFFTEEADHYAKVDDEFDYGGDAFDPNDSDPNPFAHDTVSGNNQAAKPAQTKPAEVPTVVNIENTAPQTPAPDATAQAGEQPEALDEETVRKLGSVPRISTAYPFPWLFGPQYDDGSPLVNVSESDAETHASVPVDVEK